MKLIKNISENEMIETFLKGELKSQRFGQNIKNVIKQMNIDADIINDPNLEDEQENNIRKEILRRYRGYPNSLLFHGFPQDTVWQRVLIEPEDFNKLKYMNYSYWNELSKQSRYINEAIETINKGIEIFGESNKKFFDAAEALRRGTEFPEIIVLSDSTIGDLIVLEGHIRATAILLANISRNYPAILGRTHNLNLWSGY